MLPLVAGLFVMVEALVKTGVIAELSALLHQAVAQSPAKATVAGRDRDRDRGQCREQSPGRTARRLGRRQRSPAAAGHGRDPDRRRSRPELSVTGSLATILWLVALRREKIDVSAWQFLKLGLLVTPPALIAALAAAIR